MTQMDGKNVIPALFNKRICEVFPVIVRGDAVNIAARRNPNPPGTVSTALAKAVCAALMGKVRVLRGDAQIVYLEVGSLSATQVYQLGLDVESNVWHNPRLASYHLGLIALADALARPEKAMDLLEAYNDLLACAGGPLPDLLSRTDDGQLRELILRASDELYYFLRYENGDPEPGNDRLETAVVNDDASGAEAATQGLPDLAHLLTDPVALRRYRAGTARLRPPPVPQSELHTGFVGWQTGALDRAVRHGRNALMSGYTGTGKTYCFQELAAARGFPYVTIQGKEGLLDLDFQGAIIPVANALDMEALRQVVTGKSEEFKSALVKFGGVPKMVASIVWGLVSVIGVPLLEAVLPHFLPQRREWVDGPWTRAMRRAVSERVIVFIDEINRISRHQLNILATVLNPQSRRQLELQGIQPQGESPSETWYVMEVHQTGEVLTCPAENLSVVAACNMGRAFAVHPLDAALMRRFAGQIDFDFLEERQEIELLVERTGLGEAWARVLVKVANQARGLWRTGGEVVEALDTASLLVWAEELAAELADGADGKEALLYTARFTWLPRVAGRDHLGRINEGNAGGLEMVMEDAFNTHRPGGGP